MNTESTSGMNSQFLIFICLLIGFNLILFSFIEKFPYGSYQRSETYGRLIPRSRDRDEIKDENNENNKTKDDAKDDAKDDEKNDKNSVDAIQHIDTDLDTGNYKWNGNINFPYGGFTYDRTYPVYPAPNICDSSTPYYSTLEGKCIEINNSPSANTSAMIT